MRVKYESSLHHHFDSLHYIFMLLDDILAGRNQKQKDRVQHSHYGFYI